MRAAILIVLAASCASMNTNRNPVVPVEERWPDAKFEGDAIACAAERLYGAERRAELERYDVVTRRGIGNNDDVRHRPRGGEILLNGDARSARASAWDHGAVHVILHFELGEDFRVPQCQSAPGFLEAEARFREARNACAKGR